MRSPNAVRSEFAVDRLEREFLLKLIRNEFKPGEFLPSLPRLARQYSLSESSVRSALGRLVSRGLLSHVPGFGIRCEEMLESCDIDLLLMLVRDTTELERALELEVQLLDMMSVVFVEVAYRAAACRTLDHLRWFNFYLRGLLDRVDQDAHVDYVADGGFQLLRVLAAASGSVAFTVLLNSFRQYLRSTAGLELFPPEMWSRMAVALEEKAVGRARENLQRCFDVRTTRLLEQLARLRGLKGDTEGGAPASVELAEWEPNRSDPD